jgi:hypothetical protein
MPKEERDQHKRQALEKRRRLTLQTTPSSGTVPTTTNAEDIISQAWAVVNPNDVLPMATERVNTTTPQQTTSNTDLSSLRNPVASTSQISWPEWINKPGLDLPANPLLGPHHKKPKIAMTTDLNDNNQTMPSVNLYQPKNTTPPKSTIPNMEVSNRQDRPAAKATTPHRDIKSAYTNDLVSMEIVAQPLPDGSHLTAIVPVAMDTETSTPTDNVEQAPNKQDLHDVNDCSHIPVVSWDMCTTMMARIQSKSLNTGLHTIPEVYNLLKEVESKIDNAQMKTVQEIIETTYRKINPN